MADLNRVFLAGNLTRDPTVRYTPSGMAVGDLGLAVSRKFKAGDGQNKEETCFVSVVVWGRQAETCAEYLRKGSPALIEGRLQYDEWEKDGQKFNKLRVVAGRVQFLGGPSRDRSAAAAAAPAHENETERAEEPPREPDPEPEPAANADVDEDNLPF